jgi:hypothetical protein
MSKIYKAMSMPRDSTEPVFCERYGTTPEAAREAVIEAMQDDYPVRAHRISENWRNEHHEADGWAYFVKEAELHGPLDEMKSTETA